MKVSINISVYFHPILDVTGSTPSEVGSPPSGEHSFVLFSTSDTERKARSKEKAFLMQFTPLANLRLQIRNFV